MPITLDGNTFLVAFIVGIICILIGGGAIILYQKIKGQNPIDWEAEAWVAITTEKSGLEAQ